MIRTRVREEAETLCAACSHGQIIKTVKGTIRICNAMYSAEHINPLPPVIDCSDYHKKGTTSVHEMEKQAWILETKKGHVIGFKRPTDKKDV